MAKRAHALVPWLLLGAAAALAAGPEPSAPDPLQHSTEILRDALVRSLSDPAFRDPRERGSLLARLRALAERGDAIDAHAAARSEGRKVPAGLSRDARELAERYEEGRYAEARSALYRVTSECVGCHQAVDSDSAKTLRARLTRGIQPESLHPRQRTRLYRAVHLVDDALAEYERVFRSPRRTAAELELSGDLAEYLEVCVRDAGEVDRPRRALRTLLRRDDVPPGLAVRIRHWLEALEEVEDVDGDAPGLARAHAMIQAADARADRAGDRDALVYYLAAAAALDAHVRAEPDSGEAYYWLGVAESRIRGFENSPARRYLATAIRLDPDAEWASAAYSLLEDQTEMAYSGSGGSYVPDEVQRELSELRELVEPVPAAPAD